MVPKLVNHNVASVCPVCEAVTTFEYKAQASREHGFIVQDRAHTKDGLDYSRAFYRLLRCASCGGGGL